MIYLKADTATEVLIGPAVAVGDGFTPVTNLVLTSADEAELIKYNGATTLTGAAITNVLAALTSAVDGYYSLELTAGELDTEGPLWLVIQDDSLILPIRQEYMVVNANVYDSLFAVSGTDTLQADVTAMAANVLTASALATDAAEEIADTVWDEDATGHQTLGTFGQAIGDPGSDATTIFQAVATDAAGDNIAVDIVAVKAETALIVADTNELQVDDVPGLIAALNDIAAGDVWAVDATTQQTQGTFGQAIGDPVADTTTIYQAVATDAAGDNVAIDIIAVKAETALIVADTNELQVDDVPGLIAALNDPTAAAVADAVWDEAMADHIAADSFGLANNVLRANVAQAGAAGTITLDSGASALADFYNGAIIELVNGTGAGQVRRITDYAVTTFIASIEPNWITNPASGTEFVIRAGGNADLRTATQTSIDAIEADTNELQQDDYPTSIAAIQSDTDDIQTRLPAALVGGRIDATIDATGMESGAVDNIWDRDATSNQTAGTFGEALGDPAATGESIRQLVGELAAAAAVGDPSSTESLMQYVKQILNVLIGTTGIGTYPASLAPANGVNLAEVLGAIYDDTNSLDGTKIPDTISLAAINAEVDTALDTAMTEISQGVPSATPGLRDGVMLMYMALRNKLDVATSGTDTLEIHNDAGTRISQKLLTDDGSDYSEAKMTSGA